MPRMTGRVLLAATLWQAAAATAADPKPYVVCVSNERSGDVAILRDRKVVATVPVGKRPRGLHASPDGRCAILRRRLSGSSITGSPRRWTPRGTLILRADEDDENADHSADGIGVVDLEKLAFLRKLPAGSDPEEFAVGKDGRKLYVSNEDVATASVVNVADGNVEQIVRVKKEPEGVAISPDGRFVYVTCETGGEVVVIDAASATGPSPRSRVGGRCPRTVAFLPDGSKAFIPSEAAGTVTVVDTSRFERVKTIALPAGSRPMGTLWDDRRGRLCVSTGRAGTVCVVDVEAGRVERVIPAGKRPWGIGLAPDGTTLYVANGPSDDVSVIDLDAGKEVGRIKVGGGPWGSRSCRDEGQSAKTQVSWTATSLRVEPGRNARGAEGRRASDLERPLVGRRRLARRRAVEGVADRRVAVRVLQDDADRRAVIAAGRTDRRRGQDGRAGEAGDPVADEVGPGAVDRLVGERGHPGRVGGRHPGQDGRAPGVVRGDGPGVVDAEVDPDGRADQLLLAQRRGIAGVEVGGDAARAVALGAIGVEVGPGRGLRGFGNGRRGGRVAADVRSLRPTGWARRGRVGSRPRPDQVAAPRHPGCRPRPGCGTGGNRSDRGRTRDAIVPRRRS